MTIQNDRLCLVTLFVLVFVTGIAAQETKIAGIVRDINTHKEIRDVNIFIKGSGVGTISDFAGRFSLIVLTSSQNKLVVFRHVAYESREIPVDSIAILRNIDLQPRVIPLQGVEIETERLDQSEIEKDIPQTISILDAKDFEIRGYVDAGDLLRIDHSIQIDEDLSGKKTASIRGGNADEVVVLYNGIKMNSIYDNVFDLSLIDVEDVEKFEIIKGSNTSLYGPEAFSGVINIIPKRQQDYKIRFNQRLGTYRAGNWGLHLFQKLNRLHGRYSFKRGGSSRKFLDTPDGKQGLENTSLHHTANLNYFFPNSSKTLEANSLGAMFIHTALEYGNLRDNESLSNFNQLLSLNYSGNISKINGIELSASLRRLEEDQFLASGGGVLERGIDEKSIHFNAEKRFKMESYDLLFAYQYQKAELDFTDVRRNFEEQQVGLESADLERRHHGFVSILKYHGETGSDFLQTIDLDASLRHDRVQDTQSDPVVRSNPAASSPAGIFNQNDWAETTVKFAVNLTGYRKDLAFNAYLNIGSNTKFPSLFQQVSVPAFLTRQATRPNLNPEKTRSLELGAVVTKDLRQVIGLSGWQFSANFFQNDYDNKFRTFSTPGIPVSFYDNAPTARISGFEGTSTFYLLNKKVTLEFGASRYFISEKSAFPFKSDLKSTANFTVDHAGYSFNMHWFHEGDQEGLLRNPTGQFFIIALPQRTNLDLHLSKTFKVGKLKAFANLSGRNLLQDDGTDLLGLAIRDRRYYITFGAQY